VLFPRLVYRTPGPHAGPPGHTFASMGVKDADALKAALAAGWHETLPDACAPKLAPIPVAPAAPDDDDPPTRAELEAKAGELGVKFDGRTPDATLARKIADALKAGV
jgi:hypothetical protein